MTLSVTELINRLSVLERRVEELEKENRALREENDRLKERLGLNSGNSSFPPSRDLYKRKLIKKSGLKPGGQPGHVGKWREKLQADEEISIHPEEYCPCGGKIVLAAKPYTHQKVELPVIKPIVTNYYLHHGRCSCCKKRYKARLPEGVSNDLLGPRAKGAVSALTGFFKNSKREAQMILEEILGLKISLGTLSRTEERVSDQCETSYQQLEEKIQQSALLHIDETGHRLGKKRGWAWVFTNKSATLIKLTESRGAKVLEKTLPNYEGRVISDRYSCYSYFLEERRQVCWSHLVRDFERFAQSRDADLNFIGRHMVSIAEEMFGLHRSLLQKNIELIFFLRRCRILRRRLRYWLKRTHRLPGLEQAKRVSKNILKCEPMMWKFLEDPLEIPPTNNLAERQIRKYVVYRKTSYFAWAERGEKYIERMLSLFLTYQRDNPCQKLLQLLMPATASVPLC